jgi:hypothetical protein
METGWGAEAGCGREDSFEFLSSGFIIFDFPANFSGTEKFPYSER